MKSVIELNLYDCSIYCCSLQEAPEQYTIRHPQCVAIRIDGDYRDMTINEIKKKCFTELRNIADFYLSVL